MSVSLLNALTSRAPQVVLLPDKHLCIDLLRSLALITGEGCVLERDEADAAGSESAEPIKPQGRGMMSAFSCSLLRGTETEPEFLISEQIWILDVKNRGYDRETFSGLSSYLFCHLLYLLLTFIS